MEKRSPFFDVRSASLFLSVSSRHSGAALEGWGLLQSRDLTCGGATRQRILQNVLPEIFDSPPPLILLHERNRQ